MLEGGRGACCGVVRASPMGESNELETEAALARKEDPEEEAAIRTAMAGGLVQGRGGRRESLDRSSRCQVAR